MSFINCHVFCQIEPHLFSSYIRTYKTDLTISDQNFVASYNQYVNDVFEKCTFDTIQNFNYFRKYMKIKMLLKVSHRKPALYQFFKDQNSDFDANKYNNVLQEIIKVLKNKINCEPDKYISIGDFLDELLFIEPQFISILIPTDSELSKNFYIPSIINLRKIPSFAIGTTMYVEILKNIKRYLKNRSLIIIFSAFYESSLSKLKLNKYGKHVK